MVGECDEWMALPSNHKGNKTTAPPEPHHLGQAAHVVAGRVCVCVVCDAIHA